MYPEVTYPYKAWYFRYEWIADERNKTKKSNTHDIFFIYCIKVLWWFSNIYVYMYIMLYLLLHDNLVSHLALIDNHNIYEVPLCTIYVYSTIYTYAIKIFLKSCVYKTFKMACVQSILKTKPLKGTWKCGLYEQLPFIYRLTLYSLCSNGTNVTVLIDSDVVYRCDLKACLIVRLNLLNRDTLLAGTGRCLD